MRGLITQRNELHYAEDSTAETICGKPLDRYPNAIQVDLVLERAPGQTSHDDRTCSVCQRRSEHWYLCTYQATPPDETDSTTDTLTLAATDSATGNTADAITAQITAALWRTCDDCAPGDILCHTCGDTRRVVNAAQAQALGLVPVDLAICELERRNADDFCRNQNHTIHTSPGWLLTSRPDSGH